MATTQSAMSLSPAVYSDHMPVPVISTALPFPKQPLVRLRHVTSSDHRKGFGRKDARPAALACAALLSGLVAGPAHAMTGGVPTPDAAPWVASLAVASDTPLVDSAGCGGVLVSPDRVLTAARCVQDQDPSKIRVHLGASVLSQNPGEVRGARTVAVMPGFEELPSPFAPDDKDLDSARYDLAVVQLSTPVTDRPFLPVSRSEAPVDSAVALYSHGLTGDNGARDDVLHRGDLTVMPTATCAAATPATVDARSIVCGQDKTPIPTVAGCWLDNGSPVVSTVHGRPELVGVYSFGAETAGRDCTPTAPSSFANAPAFRDWILGPLNERAPFPATSPSVTESGTTLQCTLPTWDTNRGGSPADVSTDWVALVPSSGGTIREFPIDGVNAPQLQLVANLHLTGNEVACRVHARSSGGSVTVRSAGLRLGT